MPPQKEHFVAHGFNVKLLLLGLVGSLLIYADVLRWLWGSWGASDDNSHGYLVPVVAIAVLWVRRDMFPAESTEEVDRGIAWSGLMMIVLGLALRLAGIHFSILTIEAISIIPFLFGVISLSMGKKVARWALPALLYLCFMIPFPDLFGGGMSTALQSLATSSSVFCLQTLGVPAVAEGNVIFLTEGTVGVAQACSGIRMLFSFFSLSVAACLVLRKPWYENVIVIMSAIPIALIVNSARITMTGLAYEHSESKLAEHIIHDMAGWAMIPLGMLCLVALLAVMRQVFVEEESVPALDQSVGV